MKTERQIKIDWLWLLLQPLLVKALQLFGDTFFEWLREKMDSDDDIKAAAEHPECGENQYWNGTQCVLKVGRTVENS